MARILIADSDDASRQILRETLEAQPKLEVVDDLDEGSELSQLIGPLNVDVVVLDLGLRGVDAIDLAGKLRGQHRALGIVLTGDEPTFDDLRAALRAGADDFLPKPLETDTAGQNIAEVAQRVEQRRALLATSEFGSGPVHAKVVAVYSPQGGVGKSMLAANLAVVLARESGRPTVLVDLNLQFGDIDLMLNITPERTVAAVIQRMNQLDADLMESFLTLHDDSNLKVLAAPARPEYADTITTFVVEKVLQVLRERHTYIVIDTPSFLQDTTLTALDHSDEIILLTALDLLALHNTKTALAMMQKLRYGPDKVKLVLNRSNADVGISPEDVEQTLEYDISAYIPSDGRVAVTSVNEGEPFVLSQPKTQIAQSIRRIAYQVMDREAEFLDESPEPVGPTPSGGGGILGWFRGG
ncbi:MAG: response regulator [Fimbriimonadaceae bacterium]|nr:response regulator [Fimbriimonadaceae bacterium]